MPGRSPFRSTSGASGRSGIRLGIPEDVSVPVDAGLSGSSFRSAGRADVRTGSIGKVARVTANQDQARPVTTRLRVLVAGLLGLEVLVGLAAAVFLVVEVATSRISKSDHPGAVLFLVALALVLGVGLLACARGVLRGDAWTRGPVVTWQLVQLAISVPLSTSSTAWWAGVPLLAVAVVVGVLMLGKQVVPWRVLPS